MSGRDDRIYQEACALWRELYDDAPPTGADGATILDMITGKLPQSRYDRITSPYMRPTTISYPKKH